LHWASFFFLHQGRFSHHRPNSLTAEENRTPSSLLSPNLPEIALGVHKTEVLTIDNNTFVLCAYFSVNTPLA